MNEISIPDDDFFDFDSSFPLPAAPSLSFYDTLLNSPETHGSNLLLLPSIEPDEKSEKTLEWKQDEERDGLEQQRKRKQREAVKRHRKRKSEEIQQLREQADDLKKQKQNLELQLRALQTEAPHSSLEHTPSSLRSYDTKLLDKRKANLDHSWKAWNVGGVDELQDIAAEVFHPQVTLITPDQSEEVKGMEQVLKFFVMFDAFPDGILEQFHIEEETNCGERVRVTWVFSGTQVSKLVGIEPRQERVKLSGKAYIAFHETKMKRILLIWNYRDALSKLMGIPLADLTFTNAASRHPPTN